jgi:hypothetical protein
VPKPLSVAEDKEAKKAPELPEPESAAAVKSQKVATETPPKQKKGNIFQTIAQLFSSKY